MRPSHVYSEPMSQRLHILDTTQSALARLQVQALYLFGSRAIGTAGEQSDYDFAVLMPQAGHSRGDLVYHALYDLLTDLLPVTTSPLVVDIVFVRDAPLELAMHVVRYGNVLWESDAKARANFTAHTTLLYADFRPILDEMDHTMLESL